LLNYDAAAVVQVAIDLLASAILEPSKSLRRLQQRRRNGLLGVGGNKNVD
jgi:hypothetical protein